ncbi:MAG: HIRAN domain-containing protein [Gemmatimonadetes bacterium]|nr:HIRAN domain-containing protein [Gemmatimonadota bacterium]
MIRLVDPLDRPGRAREFRCTVHGLCFENRYRLLGALHAGDPLILEREPENAIGADAIRVRTEATEILGYLPREISRWLAPQMDAGREARAWVLKIRSGCPYYERLVIEVSIA